MDTLLRLTLAFESNSLSKNESGGSAYQTLAVLLSEDHYSDCSRLKRDQLTCRNLTRRVDDRQPLIY